MSTIGFLGLGNMGAPMAANLVAAGHRVVGFDPVPAAAEAAGQAGVPTVASAGEAAAGADFVITMLPSGKHVLDAYGGEAGLVATVAANTLLIDCSTIDVADARAAHELAAGGGFDSLDAPVSGGVVGAEAGTLTFMVGGSEAAYGRAAEILDVMGKRAVHCGEGGAGQAAKMCNNLILGISMIGVSEAFVLAEKLGLSHQALFDVASTSSGQCWSLTTNCPVPGPVPASPANRDYRPGFAAALMLKDLGLATAAAEKAGVDARLGQHAAEMFRQFNEAGGGGSDFSGIINDIRERSEKES